MGRIARFQSDVISPGKTTVSKCDQGVALTDLYVKLGGSMTGSGTGTLAVDGIFHAFGRPRVQVGSRTIFDMPGPDWRHLTAFFAGAYPQISPAGTTAGTQIVAAFALINFRKLMPGARIAAADGEDITFTTRWGGLTDLGALVTVYGGDLEIVGEADDAFDGSGLYFEPHFRTAEIGLLAKSDNELTFNFADTEIVAGFMFRQLNESQRLIEPNLSRPDNLVRRITVERQRLRRSRETVMPQMGWSMLKQGQSLRHGISTSTGQIHTGVAFHLIDDPFTEAQEAAVFNPGDQLKVSADTLFALEPDLNIGAEALEPGADKLYVTVLGFRPRGRAYLDNPREVLARSGLSLI